MSRRYTTHKLFNVLLHQLVLDGWSITKHTKHLKIRDPTGVVRAVASFSPGDHRAFLNFRADIRKARRDYERHKHP